MSRLTEIIAGLFSSDRAILTDDGQRVISQEMIIPEVEGLILFDEEVPGSAEEAIEEVATVTEAEVVAEVPAPETVYATVEMLEEIMRRLDRLDNAIIVPEVESEVRGGMFEQW